MNIYTFFLSKCPCPVESRSEKSSLSPSINRVLVYLSVIILYNLFMHYGGMHLYLSIMYHLNSTLFQRSLLSISHLSIYILLIQFIVYQLQDNLLSI